MAKSAEKHEAKEADDTVAELVAVSKRRRVINRESVLPPDQYVDMLEIETMDEGDGDGDGDEDRYGYGCGNGEGDGDGQEGDESMNTNHLYLSPSPSPWACWWTKAMT